MATPMRSTDFRSVVEPILNEVFDGVYEQRADEMSNPVGPEEPLQPPAGRSKAPACSDRRRWAALDGNGQPAQAR